MVFLILTISTLHKKRSNPGAYCIQLLPEKNSTFTRGKVNGKFMLTGVFRFYQSFSPVKVLCNRPLMFIPFSLPTYKAHPVDISSDIFIRIQVKHYITDMNSIVHV